MWKSFTKSKADPAFYMKVEVLENKRSSDDQNRYKISVTNYVKLWTGEFDNDGIQMIMLDSNKNVESSDGQGFLLAALSMLNNPKQVNMVEFAESSTGHLDIKLKRTGGIVIKMNFTLRVCCAEEFFDVITRPLLLIIDDQKKSETELRRLMEGMRKYLIKIRKESGISGDRLMRYEKLEIDEYNDEKHMKIHDSMEDFFGTDPEERIDPRHILYGRPLPARPYYMPLPIKEEKDLTVAGPSLVPSSDTLISTRDIKKELTEESQGITISNIPSQIEHTGSNCDGNESNKGKSEPNCINKRPKDTSYLKDNYLQTVVGPESFSQTLRPPEVQSLNELSPTTDIKTKYDALKGPSVSPNSTSHLNSAEIKSEHRSPVTPKKRRKNLNY